MDDPLGLLVQAVAVLAAGMYPIGFMFGACSDCCCPKCNFCNHHYDGIVRTDTDFANAQSLVNTAYTLNVSTGTSTGSLEQLEIVLAGLSVDTGLVDENNDPILAKEATFTVWETLADPVYDACGCVVESKIALRLSAVVLYSFDGDGNTSQAATAEAVEGFSPFFVIGNTCEQDSADLDASAVVWEDLGAIAEFETPQPVIDWLSGLTISGLLTFDPCECGACCRACGEEGVSCSDNVAEGFCGDESPLGVPQVWRGSGTTCAVEGCPTGSCCNAATGGCTETYEWNCAGTWTANAVCNPNPCPQPPEGACCDGNGECSQTIEVDCAGTWTEGVECDPNPCPQLGSCCDPATGDCTQTLEANCAGTWTEGEPCDPNPCPQPPLGACCDGEGGCSQTTQANCPGVWYEGTACDPNPCVLGWCCEYFEGNLTSGYGPVPEGECAFDDPAYTYVWTEGGEIECPPTNP